MKTNDTIKVHLYDLSNKEIKTKNYGKTFYVYEKNGKLGIDWNTEKLPYSLKHWSTTQCATTARTSENLAKGQQIKYIVDASIKRLTNLSRLYMHRLRNK